MGIAHVEVSNYKKEVVDKYIDGFFKTYAPEHVDKYWLCGVLRSFSP